jgi:hypothetical protein
LGSDVSVGQIGVIRKRSASLDQVVDEFLPLGGSGDPAADFLGVGCGEFSGEAVGQAGQLGG